MSGTELASAGTGCPVLSSRMLLPGYLDFPGFEFTFKVPSYQLLPMVLRACYALSGFLPAAANPLRTCYALSGTDLGLRCLWSYPASGGGYQLLPMVLRMSGTDLRPY
eukprot:854223-Rhodomonas_salina.1